MKQLSSLLAFILVAQFLSAQIDIVGANYDLGTGTIGVIRWNANTGAILDTVATPAQGVAIGSSVFDAYNGIYYFADFAGLNGIDLDSRTVAAFPGTDISTSAEIDMASGKIFGVRNTDVLDSSGMVISSTMDMVQYHIANNTETVIGTFAGNEGVYLDASCYNSNLGIYYFIGIDSALGQCLYAVPTRDSVFSYTLVPMPSQGRFVQTLEYDNEANILYALMLFVGIPGSEHFLVEQIDPTTGALTLEVDFPQYSSYQIGTCSFHQSTSSIVFVLPDSTGPVVRIYNTISNTLTAGILPIQFINEFECDNSIFAQLKYGVTAIESPTAPTNIMTYPNPAIDVLHLRTDAPIESMYITDAMGRSMPFTANGSQVDVSGLAPGCYLLIAKLGEDQWSRSKFIKQ